MLLVFSAFYLAVLLIVWIVIKDTISKWFIFFISSYWFVSLIISTLNPFGLFNVSQRTYNLLFIDVFCFLIGYLCFSSSKMQKTLHIDSIKVNIEQFYKSKIFIGLFSFCIVVLVYYFFRQWQIILLQNGLGNLKLETFDLVFNGNHLMYNIYELVVSPMFHVVLALTAFLLLNKGNKKHILIFFIYILLFGFIGGKRAYFLTFFFYLLVAFFINNTYVIKRKIEKFYLVKKGVVIMIIFGVVFGFMIFMTSLSGGIGGRQERFKEVGEDLLKQFVIYSVGPFRALDIGLDNNYVEEAGGYLFGRASLGGGIDYYTIAILRRVGVNWKSARERTMNKLQNQPVVIGSNTDFNFAYTNAMYHYYDFGVFGVFLFPFLFGWFVRYTIYKFYMRRTFSLLILISLLFFACVQMLQFWYFIGLYPLLFVCVLLYLSKKEYKYIVLKKLN